MNVAIATSRLLWTPTLGGHLWVNLNWALGLQENGVQVTLIETLPETIAPDTALERVRAFQGQLRELGLDAAVALRLSPAQEQSLAAVLPAIRQHAQTIEQVLDEAGLLLTFEYSMPGDLVARFRRSALVDIDPGLLQMWLHGGAFTLAPHDRYFTIGETVGQPGALFPDCGIDWIYTPPPVHLASWPVRPPAEGAAYTTVTNWWASFEVDRGETFNNEKRTSFLECLDLPSRTRAPLELAIYHEPGQWSEFDLLREHGWRARPAAEVSASPAAYRRYLQDSRGEFSCAKPSCMRFQNAWISDRTICYLASGKPCIVQHTGSSRFLPDDAGLFRFRTVAEAAACLERVEADYEHQCALARSLAVEHFTAAPVVARVLERALA